MTLKSTLEQALRGAGQTSIGVDLYGPSYAAKFYRSLLRTIVGMQVEIKYLERRIRDRNRKGRTVEVQSPERKEEAQRQFDSPVFEAYAVDCNENFQLCLDRPRPTVRGGQLHAQGEKLLGVSLENVLESRPNIEAVILKVVECPHTVVPNQSAARYLLSDFSDGGVSSRLLKIETQVIFASEALQQAVTSISKYQVSNSGHSGAVNTLTDEISPQLISLQPSDPFLFHHLKLLHDMGSTATPTTALFDPFIIGQLLSFCEPLHRETFSHVRGLFEAGYVDRMSLNYLFHPNMPVISYRQGEPVIGVIRNHPNLTEMTSSTNLDCWVWKFDGHEFKRVEETFTIQRPLHGTSKITDLGTFPLSHATEVVRNSLRERGVKYWSLRKGRYCSYTGWDANKDLSHVSAVFSLLFKSSKQLSDPASIPKAII